MIILDTHIWVWWVHGDERLSPAYSQYIKENETAGLGISVISCWEVAKLVERSRLILPVPIDTWFTDALSYTGMILLDITPQICIESTILPGTFHQDPADQLIVATARIHNCPLVTMDQKIKDYPHVSTATSS
ncbi:MAG: type II toxin-antitoxin system VapC family toxin [bacterium]